MFVCEIVPFMSKARHRINIEKVTDIWMIIFDFGKILEDNLSDKRF